MRISPINTLSIRTQKNNVVYNQNLRNQKMSISFKSSSYEEEVEREVESKRKNYNWLQWNLGGAEEKERKAAKVKIDKKNHENELKRLEAETINRETEKRMGELRTYTNNLENIQRRQESLLEGYQKSHEETVLIQKQALEAQSKAAESLKTQLQDYQKIMREQQELQEKKDRETQELIKKMEEARENHDKKLEERFEKELEHIQKIYETQMNAKSQEAQKIRNIEEIYKKMGEISNNKGFGRLAGYQNEKELLLNYVGTPIVLEKDGQDANVPNGILFFGPKGNGKTVFAESFAEQLDCYIEKVDNVLDDTENMKNLREIAKTAQEKFEQTGIRTIIQIDEFDDFAPKGASIVGPIKSFLDTLSKKYHCTIFATTNFPEKIDDILLRDGRFEIKVPLEPANKQNALEILKFYGESFADNTVNFEKLAEEVTKDQPLLAYSNDRLSHFVSSYIKRNNLMTKMSHSDFLEAIKDKGPDIKKEAMELFKKQIEYVRFA